MILGRLIDEDESGVGNINMLTMARSRKHATFSMNSPLLLSMRETQGLCRLSLKCSAIRSSVPMLRVENIGCIAIGCARSNSDDYSTLLYAKTGGLCFSVIGYTKSPCPKVIRQA